MKRPVTFLAIALVAFVGLTSCDTSSSDNAAVIEGRVEGGSSPGKALAGTPAMSSVEGAVVTAGRVQTDGSIDQIQNVEAQTEADGSFSLEVPADAAERIVVRAEKNGQRWYTFVSGEIENGNTIRTQPINVESTAESRVYTDVVAEGGADIVSTADIEAYIDQRTASQIYGNTSAIADVSAAIIAEAEARADYYSSSSTSATRAQFEQAVEAKTRAQAELEARLHEAGSPDEEEAAFDAFLNSQADAYTEADIRASTYAESKNMSNHVMMQSTGSISAEAKEHIRSDAALLTATAVDAAVHTEMEAMGASDDAMQSVTDAGVQLRSDIRAVAEASESEVEAAFQTYEQAIVEITDNQSSADAGAVVEVNGEINASGGAKTTFESSIEATLALNLLFDAYSTFHSAIESQVESNLQLQSSAEAAATTQILMLANMGS